MRRVLLVFLLLSSLVFAQARGNSASQEKALPPAEPEATPRVLPGDWELKPLVRIGDPAPETGGRFQEFSDVAWVDYGGATPDMGRRLQEFSEVFWLDSGVLVFWGRFGPKHWGLYSWKDAQLTLVVPEGNKVQAPHAEGVTEKLDVHRRWGWGLRTIVQAGKSVVYITPAFGSFRPTASVYSWDGQYLRKVLARGDTISLGGIAHTLRSAWITSVGADGALLVRYETEKPRKTIGLALFDGVTLTPVLAYGDELPGMPGVKPFGGIWVNGLNLPAMIGMSPISVPGAMIAVLRLDKLPYPAVYRLAANRFEKLVAPGDPHPIDPKQKVQDVSLLGAWDPAEFLFCVNGRDVFLTWHGESKKIFDDSWMSNVFNVDANVWSVRQFAEMSFAKLGELDYVFLVTLSRPATGREESRFSGRYLELVEVMRSAFLRFDGRQVINLTQAIPLGRTSDLHWMAGDFPGLLLHAKPPLREVSSPEFIERVRIVEGWHPRETWWFLAANAAEKGLEPVPEFHTTDGRRVHLGQVLAWRRPGEAVVQLGDGFYLLAKREEATPQR